MSVNAAFADVETAGRIKIGRGDGTHWLTPGEINAAAIRAYRFDQCAAFAQALSELSGWPVALVRAATPMPRMVRAAGGGLVQSDEMVNWTHAVVRVDDGEAGDAVVDICGRASTAETCALWLRLRPENGPYRVEALTPSAQAAWVAEMRTAAPRSALEWAVAWDFASTVFRRVSARTP